MHTRDLIRFLEELSENNNRAWFVMNKPRYDILRAEFLDLVTILIREAGRFDPAIINCEAKKTLFRINRDMRFSRDKGPYKTHFSAAITASGMKKPSQGGGPAYYFHINGGGQLLVAGGEYMPPPERVRAIRRSLLSDAAGFANVLKNRRLRSSYGDLRDQDKLVRVPKDYDGTEEHAEYLKFRSYMVRCEINLKQAIPEHLDRELVGRFRDAYPLVNWLRNVR